MADQMKIGAGLALDGEKQFKDAVKSINKELTVLGSEMKKVTSQFSDNADSMEALNAKQDVYNKRAEEQRKKVETLTTALEAAKKEFGENSDKVKDWQIKLNNAEADLANTEKSIKDTANQIENFGKESENSGEEVEKAGKKAKGSGDDAEKGKGGWEKLGTGLAAVGKVAGQAVLALGAAAAGAATAIGAMTMKAAQNADEINTLAKQTGLSTEEIQKFQYAAEMIDVPLETMTKSMAKNIKSMKAVQDGTLLSVEAYEALGVSVLNADGSLRDGQTVYGEVIDALGKMENETERDALAMQILGKSAQDLNPLILGGADALKELGDEAAAAGLILEQDALDNLNSFADEMDRFKSTLSGSGSLFATAFAGPMAEGLSTLTGYLTELTAAFKEGGFDGLADKFGEVLSDVTNKITEYLPKIIDFGTAIITKLIEGITKNIPQIVQSAILIISNLAESLIEMLPMLVQAAADIVIQLALGIADALPELIPTVIDTILIIVDTLIENIDLLIDASIAIVVGIATGIVDALPKLIEKVPQIIISIVDAIIANLPKIAEAALEIIVMLGSGIISSLSELLSPVGEVITTIVDAFSDKFSEIVNIGKNIVEGVWQGISNAASWLWDKVTGFFSGIIDGVKNTLGIASPSKVFAGIGENMGLGLGSGFLGAMDQVTRDINNAIPTSLNGKNEIRHTGIIRIEGVNNNGEFVGAADLILDQLRMEARVYG